MQIHWTYTGCDHADEREIERLWERRQTAIEAKLAEVPAEPRELRLAFDHDTDDEEAWSMHAALHLPGRTLVAEAERDTIEAVFERVFSKLARAIDRYEDRATHVVAGRSGLHAVLPLLERFHSAGRSQAFFVFLVPVVRSLRPYVRHELEILQLNESLPEESVRPADVLDEAMLRAWERFKQRPPALLIDLWLTQIVDEVLASVTNDRKLESLDERVPLPLSGPDEASSADYWVEREDDPETIEFGDLLEGPDGIDGWDRLDAEGKQTRLAEVLGSLPREQRQALMLMSVQGVEPAEIADFQNRSLAAVQSDIEAGRRTLLHEFSVKPDVEDVEEAIDVPRSRNRHRH